MIGELSGIFASLCWATCTFFYDKCINAVPAQVLNFIKQLMASSILFLIILIINENILTYGYKILLVLSLSGIIGISIGDLFWLLSVKTIGPRVTLILELLTPIFTFLLTYFYLNDPLSYEKVIGMIICIFGVYLSIYESNPTQNQREQKSPLLLQTHDQDEQLTQINDVKGNKQRNSKKQDINQDKPIIKKILKFIKGIFYYLHLTRYGVLFVIFQAIGSIMVNQVFQYHSEIHFIGTTFVRLFASTIFVTMAVLMLQFKEIRFFSLPSKDKLFMTMAILVECIIGHNLQSLTLKYLRPDIGQTLLALAPIWGLFIELIKGKSLTWNQYLGTFVAFGGVYIMINL